MRADRGGPAGAAPGADSRRRVILFAIVDGIFVFLVLLPALIYLFVLDNGLSERDLMFYGIGLIALQAAVTGLLLWTFRIIPGLQSDKRDAR